MEIELPNNWQPRDYQMNLWKYLEGGGKRAVAVWHRRAGKDDVCLHWTAVAMMQRPATYWHMLPEAAQARKAIWDAVNPHTGKRRIDEAFPLELRSSTREHEMMIKFKNGSTWQVVGSDNYDSLVGSPPVGVTLSEWSVAKQDAWAYLRPILMENDGWAFFIYTPRGENHGLNTYNLAMSEDDWFGELLTADDTRVFTPEQLAQEKRELAKQYGQSRGEALFRQEYYCSFVEAFTGKQVYPDFNRKTHVASQDLLPVIIKGIEAGRQVVRGWDNTGLHPACVLTYVNTIGQWYIFKEFWGDDITCVDFADSVLLWCNTNLPSGTKYRDIADPAGHNRDSMKKSAAQWVFEECNLRLEKGLQTFRTRIEVVTQRLNKMMKGEPGLVIDPNCSLTINGFEGGYCYPEIGKSGMYKSEISGDAKNKFADIHDAIQYPATRLFGVVNEDDDYEEYIGPQEGKSKYGGY